jgi:hypothetical protein
MATTNPETITTPAETITISADDLSAANTFLQQYLSSALPQGDFSVGSALYDLTVNAISYVVAYFNYQITTIQQGLSVANVAAMPAGADQDNAVNALMSNLFVQPTAGQNSTGFVVCYLSQLTDVLVPPTALFNANATTSFTLNSTTNLLIPSTQLTPIVNPLGVIQQYQCSIPVISTGVGVQYNIQPTTFLSYTPFNPYITQIVSTTTFTGGLDTETSSQLLAAAPTAITLRDLTSNRAISTTLTTNFPQISEVVVVAYGDPEMQRDVVPDASSIGLIHAGDNVDVYVGGTIAPNQTFTGTVGGFFTNPSPDITIFTDSTFFNSDGTPNGNTFNSTSIGGNIVFGDVLNIVFESTTYSYLVQSVNGPYLQISPLSPFPQITSGLPYSIGAVAPNYYDKINNLSSNENGECTDIMFISGAVGMPQTPIYQVSSVNVYDPTSSFANTNGLVSYTQQNGAPPTFSLGLNDYALYCGTPAWASSAEQLVLLYVANDDSQDGNPITVVYDTIADFGDIDEYCTNQFNRNPAASILAKGLFAAYLNFTLGYTLNPSPPANAGAFSEQACATAIVNYVNTFPASETLHVSNIISFVLANFPMLLSCYPYVPGTPNLLYTVNYDLWAPNGNVIPYQTTDYVLIDTNHIQLASTSPFYISNPSLLGISGRTVQPLLNVDDIQFQAV